MTPARALSSLRHDLTEIRAWIKHWQADAIAGLPSTAASLHHAHRLATHALGEVDHLHAALVRVEDEIAAAPNSQILGALVERRAAIKQQINQTGPR